MVENGKYSKRWEDIKERCYFLDDGIFFEYI